MSLATLGVVVTAALVGVFAAWVLGLGWLEGLLLGAIVGSTDAAAVFARCARRARRCNERVAATLEIESGSNDPMAVFLTVGDPRVSGRRTHRARWSSLAFSFMRQFIIGAALGLAGGTLLVWLINRLTLITGPLPAACRRRRAAGLCRRRALRGGSGFLAIYLAGLVLGNSRLQAAQNILRVHDGLAWLSQIVMFLILGLAGHALAARCRSRGRRSCSRCS